MTLGKYIEILQKADQDKVLDRGLGNPDSWRGDYNELAFEIVEDISVASMLEQAKDAVGRTYEGYKGGEYLMDEHTRIHIDPWGHWSDGEVMWNFLLSLLLYRNQQNKIMEDSPKHKYNTGVMLTISVDHDNEDGSDITDKQIIEKLKSYINKNEDDLSCLVEQFDTIENEE